jgi:hypothetical protein
MRAFVAGRGQGSRLRQRVRCEPDSFGGCQEGWGHTCMLPKNAFGAIHVCFLKTRDITTFLLHCNVFSVVLASSYWLSRIYTPLYQVHRIKIHRLPNLHGMNPGMKDMPGFLEIQTLAKYLQYSCCVKRIPVV